MLLLTSVRGCMEHRYGQWDVNDSCWEGLLRKLFNKGSLNCALLSLTLFPLFLIWNAISGATAAMLRPHGILGDRTHVLTMAEPKGRRSLWCWRHHPPNVRIYVTWREKRSYDFYYPSSHTVPLGMWVDGHAFFCDLQSHIVTTVLKEILVISKVA